MNANNKRQRSAESAARTSRDAPVCLLDAAAAVMLTGKLFVRMRDACVEELAPTADRLRRQDEEIRALRAQAEDATSRLEASERENATLAMQLELVEREREMLTVRVREVAKRRDQYYLELLRLKVDKAAREEVVRDLTDQVERLRGFETMVRAVRSAVGDDDKCGGDSA